MNEFGLAFEAAARTVLSENSGQIIRLMHSPPGWLRKGTQAEDTRLIGDAVVEVDGIMIGIRVRRNQYLETFKNEVTIRSKARGGCHTEWQKILSGAGHLMFYAFASPSDDPADGFAFWRVIDFHRLRERIQFGTLESRERGNGDGTAFIPLSVGPRSALRQCSILTSETSPQMSLWEALS